MTGVLAADLLMGPAVEVRNLTAEFAPRDGPVRAVDGVSLSVDGGQILAIVGESGSGKSVLLQAILGLVRGTRRASFPVKSYCVFATAPSIVRTPISSSMFSASATGWASASGCTFLADGAPRSNSDCGRYGAVGWGSCSKMAGRRWIRSTPSGSS